MKKTTAIFSLALSLVLFLAACGTNTPAATPTIPTSSADTVIATGHLVPNQSVYLTFLASGQVEEILVKQGDHVSQGQVLARLGDREQVTAALAGAQAQATAAQQAYDLLVRTAGLGNAQAWQNYMNAQKARAAAQLAWDQLDQPTIQTNIDNAQTDVTSRQKDLATAQADLAKYSNLSANDATRINAEDNLRAAQINYDFALQKVQNLTNNRDAIRSGLNAGLAAEAEAKRTYENTLNGPDADKLALVKGQLEAANALVVAAQTALDNYDLKAPFDGTVADTNISISQMVSPQTWAVALMDSSQWYVDTSDLTEMDVVKVKVGQAVKISADALPGVSMTGVVDSISGAPKVQGGDIMYTVHIRLNNPDPRLLWGMTMEATFTP
jgi:multidrug efflux pump subunit AcrA (membrane-fusion protein)